MRKIGITGLMGSGKSHCSKIFAKLGVPIFDSDEVARTVINTDQSLKDEIAKEFGEIYDENGKMIPGKIRSIVFVEGGEDKLKRLNAIAHPYVFRELKKFFELHRDKKYTIAESAILYETGMQKYVDEVIFVDADEKIRIERAFKRSGFSEDEYKQRMKGQFSREYKVKESQYIIHNNDGDDAQKQVEEINNYLNKTLEENYK
jgi:dephospho-CoA kinase